MNEPNNLLSPPYEFPPDVYRLGYRVTRADMDGLRGWWLILDLDGRGLAIVDNVIHRRTWPLCQSQNPPR